MIRLMVVDDEMELRNGIIGFIEMNGEYGIKICGAAGNGEEALQLLPEARPDVMLLDINMPKKDGLETLRAIHKMGLNIKVIIFSSFDEYFNVRSAFKSGAFDFLQKPCSMIELVNQINCACFKPDKDKREILKEITGDEFSYIIKAAMEYIGSHYEEELGLKEVAKQLFVTPSYLSTLFKKETGIKITDYIHKFRVEKACEKLVRPEIKMYHIAGAIGYKEEKYFYYVFKKYMGMTPKQYRALKLNK